MAHAKSTNATLGMLKTKLAGYINGIVATLKEFTTFSKKSQKYFMNLRAYIDYFIEGRSPLRHKQIEILALI